MRSSSAPKLLLLHHKAPVLLGESGLAIPYSMDFSMQATGALPYPWVGGSTWVISSGVATNNPALGIELLADPGLEATYTAGKCDSLVKGGTPTLAQSADVHGGSKAQSFLADVAGEGVDYATPAQSVTTWFRGSMWAKRSSGTNGADRSRFRSENIALYNQFAITAASYTQYSSVMVAKAGTFLGVWNQGGAGAYDTIIMDDMSLKAHTFSELIATLPNSQANVTVKARITMPASRQTVAGVIARADSRTNPTNYLIAVVYPSQTTGWLLLLWKCVNGTYTELIDASITHVANALLEIRCNGTTIQAWYNNSQIGANQTVDEATINNNKIHGMVSSDGGNSLNSFFLSAPT